MVFLGVYNEKDGVHEFLIFLLMLYVKTISYFTLVNGEPKGFIKPIRDIRQGDHLSPFLFLLCIEGLHGLISQVAKQGIIRGFFLSSRNPELTDLLFANDSLLFCKSAPKKCQKVLDILGVYERCSSQ